MDKNGFAGGAEAALSHFDSDRRLPAARHLRASEKDSVHETGDQR
jgi:hypothetical protein